MRNHPPDLRDPREMTDTDRAIDRLWRTVEGGEMINAWITALEACYEGRWRIRNKGEGPVVVHCVFHEERTPSLFLYPDGGFMCYGCGACGDLVDFIDRKGLSPEDIVARKVNSVAVGQLSLGLY